MYAVAMDGVRIRRARPEAPWKRRGRQLALGVALVLALGFGLAQSVHGGAPSAYETVTVQPGDTLWTIASRRYPGADVREKVGEIERANGLAGPGLVVGESLKVPTG